MGPFLKTVSLLFSDLLRFVHLKLFERGGRINCVDQISSGSVAAASVACDQCDQIWRNFATLEICLTFWQMFEGLISILTTLRTHRGNGFGPNFDCFKWPNSENII